MTRHGLTRGWSAARGRIAELLGRPEIDRGGHRKALRVVLDRWAADFWLERSSGTAWVTAVAAHVERVNLLNVGLEASYLLLTADDGQQIAVDLDEVVLQDVSEFLAVVDPACISRDVARRFPPDFGEVEGSST